MHAILSEFQNVICKSSVVWLKGSDTRMLSCPVLHPNNVVMTRIRKMLVVRMVMLMMTMTEMVISMYRPSKSQENTTERDEKSFSDEFYILSESNYAPVTHGCVSTDASISKSFWKETCVLLNNSFCSRGGLTTTKRWTKCDVGTKCNQKPENLQIGTERLVELYAGLKDLWRCY